MTAVLERPASGRSPGRAERKRPPRPRRRRIGRVLVTILVALALAGLGWLIAFSPVLATEQVRVGGAKIASPDAVRVAAAVPLGRPLARQDVRAIQQRVAALPAIDQVEVHRVWPNAIAIEVTERKPLLAIRAPDSVLLVDHEGVVFERVASVPDGVITADVDVTDQTLLVQAGRVAIALPASLRAKVATLHVTSADAMVLRLTSGVVVTWGGAADSELKAQVVEALLKRKPRSIDVSAPHSPATR